MPTWSEFQDELERVEPNQRGSFIVEKSKEYCNKIKEITGRNVLFYASSFLQKPQVAGLFTAINREDINAFMSGVHGLEFDKGLLLILHTQGGMAEATQTIVDYLRSKFQDIEVLVPTYAMSAGTMIALACDRIIMGRQSQLGPTDPQLIVGNRQFSAHSIVAQFDEAKNDIATNVAMAHAWAPVLRSFGPALLQEARRSMEYSRKLVQEWLRNHMFAQRGDAETLSKEVAEHFCGQDHGSHGRRINRDEARGQHLTVTDLECNQDLQDAALTLYHLSTTAFEKGPAVKALLSTNGRLWVKNAQEVTVQEPA